MKFNEMKVKRCLNILSDDEEKGRGVNTTRRLVKVASGVFVAEDEDDTTRVSSQATFFPLTRF